MWTLKPQRVAVVAATALPVTPPVSCRSVRIRNTTPDDIRVYEDPTDESTYLVIASGYSEEYRLATYRFDPMFVAFYLKPTKSGTVSLVWM